MKCEAVKKLLPALAGGDLGLDRRDAAQCEAHVAGCAGCAQELDELKGMLALVRRVGKQEERLAGSMPGFRLALHRRLAEEPPPPTPLAARLFRLLEPLRLDSPGRLGMAVGFAALLVLAIPAVRSVGNGLGGHGSSTEQEVAAAFRVPQQRIAVVRFDFVADVEVPDVEFEVTLPSELNFIDDGKVLPDRRLVWRGSLSSGSNLIPLAVRGSKPGRYRVTAQARGDGLSVRHDILLEVVRS